MKANEEVLSEPQPNKDIPQVKWLSFYKALEIFYFTWDSLVTFFQQEVAQGLDKDGTIKPYIGKLTEYGYVATIHMFLDVLPVHVMQLTLIFQKKDLDCSLVVLAV